jgi:Fibronectin type III domain
MTISTSSSTPDSAHHSAFSVWIFLPGMVLGGFAFSSSRRRSKKKRPGVPGKWRIVVLSASLLSLALALFSCGGASSGGGIGGNCSAVPTVPNGLAASSTTGTSTTLNWSASSATVGCSITYTVYEGINGAQPTPLANTTTNTNYVVSGLTTQTQYTFEVAAVDSFGNSALSAPISITTTGALYTITVTGTSAGAPADSRQSTQVSLVVD